MSVLSESFKDWESCRKVVTEVCCEKFFIFRYEFTPLRSKSDDI